MMQIHFHTLVITWILCLVKSYMICCSNGDYFIAPDVLKYARCECPECDQSYIPNRLKKEFYCRNACCNDTSIRGRNIAIDFAEYVTERYSILTGHPIHPKYNGQSLRDVQRFCLRNLQQQFYLFHMNTYLLYLLLEFSK